MAKTEGGPETPLSLGQLPEEVTPRPRVGAPTRMDVRQSFVGGSPISPMQIRQAQGAVSMPGMETSMDGSSAGTANASINPVLQQRYQQRRSPDEAFDFAGNRFTEEDFYAGSETPWETKASGGDPIFVATGGNVPLSGIMNTFAARADKLQKKKDDLNQFIADRYKDFIDKADPRYNQKGQAWARSEMDKFVQDYANANTGGDVNLAYKSIYENPQAMAAYRAKAADVNAVLGVNKKVIPEAIDVLSRIRKGEAQVSEQELARLLAAEQGRLSFDTDIPLSERADYAGQVEDRYSEQKWWKEYGQGAMEKAFDNIQKQGGVIYDKRSGRPLLRQEAVTTYEKYIDSAAEEAVDLGIFRNIEDAKTYIRSRSPYQSEVTLSPLALGDGGGGDRDVMSVGGLEAGPEGLTVGGALARDLESVKAARAEGDRLMKMARAAPTKVERDKLFAQATNAYNQAVFAPRTEASGEYTVRWPLFKNGEAPRTSYRLNREDGSRVDVIPSDIGMESDGSLYIIGSNASVTESLDDNTELNQVKARIGDLDAVIRGYGGSVTQKEKAAEERDRLLIKQADITKRLSKQKKDEKIPVTEANMASLPGINWSALRQQGLSAIGSGPSSGQGNSDSWY